MIPKGNVSVKSHQPLQNFPNLNIIKCTKLVVIESTLEVSPIHTSHGPLSRTCFYPNNNKLKLISLNKFRRVVRLLTTQLTIINQFFCKQNDSPTNYHILSLEKSQAQIT